MTRTKQIRTAIFVIGATLLAALLLWYSVFLDFQTYVSELQSEHLNTLFASALAGEPHQLPRLNDAERLSEVEANAAADSLAEALLLDPAYQVGAVVQLWSMEEPEALDRYREGVEHMAEQRGVGSQVVVFLNGWRFATLFEAKIEEGRSDAEAQLAELEPHQQEALRTIYTRYGSKLLGGILRVSEQLRPRRVLAGLDSLGRQLTTARIDDRTTEEELAETVDDLAYEDERASQERETMGCFVQTSLDESLRFARLELDCMEDLNEEAHDVDGAVVVVDLQRHSVVSPSERAAAAHTAISQLASQLRGSVNEAGELPDLSIVEPWLSLARGDSGCDFSYEPLGFYEEADIVARCGAEVITRRISAR